MLERDKGVPVCRRSAQYCKQAKEKELGLMASFRRGEIRAVNWTICDADKRRIVFVGFSGILTTTTIWFEKGRQHFDRAGSIRTDATYVVVRVELLQDSAASVMSSGPDDCCNRA